MPIYKLCRRCKKVIIHPASYCDECQKIVDAKKEELQKARDRKYNDKRDPKYKTFYNSNDWYVLKEKKLQDEQYRCEFKGCSKLAVDVHHIKPIQTPEGWELRLDYNNLEALCIEHHNFRHNRFQKRKKVKE